VSRPLLVLLCILLFTSCTEKSRTTGSEGVTVDVKLSTTPDVVQALDQLLTTELKWKPISCPGIQLIPLAPGTVKHCFVSGEEPEALLPRISDLLAERSQKKMPWRQDAGFWVSDYVVQGPPSRGLLFSLVAPGVSAAMREDPLLKDAGTVAWFIVDNDPG